MGQRYGDSLIYLPKHVECHEKDKTCLRLQKGIDQEAQNSHLPQVSSPVNQKNCCFLLTHFPGEKTQVQRGSAAFQMSPRTSPGLPETNTHSFHVTFVHLSTNYLLKTRYMPRQEFISEVTTGGKSGMITTLLKPTVLQVLGLINSHINNDLFAVWINVRKKKNREQPEDVTVSLVQPVQSGRLTWERRSQDKTLRMGGVVPGAVLVGLGPHCPGRPGPTSNSQRFFSVFTLYWGVVDQQCCDRFRWTVKGLSHSCTRIHSPPNSPPIQATA